MRDRSERSRGPAGWRGGRAAQYARGAGGVGRWARAVYQLGYKAELVLCVSVWVKYR